MTLRGHTTPLPPVPRGRHAVRKPSSTQRPHEEIESPIEPVQEPEKSEPGLGDFVPSNLRALQLRYRHNEAETRFLVVLHPHRTPQNLVAAENGCCMTQSLGVTFPAVPQGSLHLLVHFLSPHIDWPSNYFLNKEENHGRNMGAQTWCRYCLHYFLIAFIRKRRKRAETVPASSYVSKLSSSRSGDRQQDLTQVSRDPTSRLL